MWEGLDMTQGSTYISDSEDDIILTNFQQKIHKTFNHCSTYISLWTIGQPANSGVFAITSSSMK